MYGARPQASDAAQKAAAGRAIKSEADGDPPATPKHDDNTDTPTDDSDANDAIAEADAATMLRYAAQLAAVPDNVAEAALQGYCPAPGHRSQLPHSLLWRTVCHTMAELVGAMAQGDSSRSPLGDDPGQIAAALRARYGYLCPRSYMARL